MPIVACGFSDAAGHLGRDLLIQLGPTLAVDIGFDPAYNPAVPGVPPVAGIQGVHALIDTGATECCVDSALALRLQLPIIDQQDCSGIGGVHTVNMHLAQIFVPSLDFVFLGSFAGVALSAGGQPHSALIGRTFLRHFVMSYNGGAGGVTLDGPHF